MQNVPPPRGPNPAQTTPLQKVKEWLQAVASTIRSIAKQIIPQIKQMFAKEATDPIERVGEFEGGLHAGSKDGGKTIESSFEADGVVYATEKVTRTSVVDAFIQAKESEKAEFPERAAECQLAIDAARGSGKEWMDSDYYRDMVRVMPEPEDRYAGATQFKEQVYDKYVPGCVNMRVHAYGNDEESGEYVRLGVICDPRNGFIHYGQMKAVQEAFEESEQKGMSALKSLQSHVSQIERQHGKRLSAKGRGAVEFAFQQLQTKESFTAAMAERKTALQAQALQFIAQQAQRATPEQLEGDTLNMLHLGLLNHEKEQVDRDTGWAHFEENEMGDMAAIFKDFEGKELILDGKGPFIDDEGRVHLPIDQDGRSITLNPIIANVSVQGHNKNDGVQAELNVAAFEQIERALGELPDDFEALKNRLEAGESNLEVAEEFAECCVKHGLLLSMGCLSAKDRTGYVGARLAARVAERKIDSSGADEDLKGQFSKEILSPHGSAAQVVYDNTGHTILKVSSAHLPGITRSISGVAFRALYYAQQGSVALGIGNEAAKERLRQRRSREIHVGEE